ncbi:MAG: ABC transporter ATP-binding protein [Actinomycetia bacterium]|nr:ABC transporter ATP-binding protein [Actinomycetes bacterium]
MSLLRLESVTLYAPEASGDPIVSDISFEIETDETLALVGQSGAGKTSLALAIMGLWPGKIDGNIFFMDQEMTSLNETAYQELRGRSLALLMQDPLAAINPTLTIGWQLREVLRLRRGLSRQAARKESLGWLKKVGLTPVSDLARAYLHQLSGGMAQRAALAIAMACQPRLLIADEPFSALDPLTAASQIDIFKQHRSEIGFSTLLITHNLHLAKELASKVIILKSGKIVEAGRVSSVFTAPSEDYTTQLLAAGLKPGSSK